MAIVPNARLAANSRVVGYDTRLQARANICDIYTFKSGSYNRENKSWPEDAIRGTVKDQTDTTSVVTLLENLRTAGVYGQNAAIGTEEDVRTKDYRVYQANYRKVIPKPGYGTRQLEAEKYKLYEEHEDNLGLWNMEQHGFEIRTAILERYGPNMLVGDTAGLCIPWWNPNIHIPTLGIANQPVFSTNRATHTNRIVQGLIAAGGLGQFAQRTCTAPVLEDLSNWALNPRRLVRLKIPELPTGQGFVLTVSEIQAAYLSNPTFVNNNLGSLWIAKHREADKWQNWPGMIGRYNDILIVVDPRAPMVLPSGSAVPFSMTAGYMVWDSTDNRFRGQPNAKDVAVLHGAVTYVEVEGQKLHWISDSQDYHFRLGIGTAGTRGCQLPIYEDEDTGEVLQQSSAVMLLDMPNDGGLATL
ncbi:MAG: hypothetical protein GY861_12540 [bacterium]|nr:hypothetical protein [bacterium]